MKLQTKVYIMAFIFCLGSFARVYLLSQIHMQTASFSTHETAAGSLSHNHKLAAMPAQDFNDSFEKIYKSKKRSRQYFFLKIVKSSEVLIYPPEIKNNYLSKNTVLKSLLEEPPLQPPC